MLNKQPPVEAGVPKPVALRAVEIRWDRLWHEPEEAQTSNLVNVEPGPTQVLNQPSLLTGRNVTLGELFAH